MIKGAVVAPLAGSALLGALTTATAQDLTVNVGSKDFTEQFILGAMYRLVLEDMGIPTEDRANLGGTQIAQEALVSGEIHLYPEYTGTGLTEVLGLSVDDALGGGAMATPGATMATPVTTDASQAVFDLVSARYAEEFGLVWLQRSPANNTQALAVKREFSDEQGITTISQLAAVAGDYIISAPADFPEREDGLLGLQRVYGEGFGEIEVLPVAPGLKYQALLDDQAQVVLAFGTDGQIAGYDLVVLEDDLGLWPPYNVAPVVRQEVLDAYPDVAARFDEVTLGLTDEVLSELNWRVDGDDKEEPVDVAASYLSDQGFVGS
jgi:osmoprotectant transport system substrate-binding protein